MRWNRQFLLIAYLFLIPYFSFSRIAAQERFEATVIDAQSHAQLPFASVYVDQGTSTITNAEGTFVINCQPSDVLRISYVGYKTALIAASQLNNVVMLQPQETMLQGVTVVPIGPLIDRITKETLRTMRKYKNRKADFYYRQTAFSDSTCYEFAESFLTGCPVTSLRDLHLHTGRYAALESDSINSYYMFGNFYTFSQIEVANIYAMPSRSNDIVQLFRNYDKFYDVSYWVINEDGNRVFVLEFEPKADRGSYAKWPILAASIYVDEKSLRIRRIEGRGINSWISVSRKIDIFRTRRRIMPTNFTFHVEFSDNQKYPEVQSVYIEEKHDIDGHMNTTHSLLFNLGGDNADESKATKHSLFQRIGKYLKEQYRPTQKGDALNYNTQLHNSIARQGYDPEFWDRNEIVRRTPIEEKVLELFKQKNLFGVMGVQKEENEE